MGIWDKNWELLILRFGKTTEGIIFNVETMFRSLEFMNFLKKYIANIMQQDKS